jgi:hypothetical protein
MALERVELPAHGLGRLACSSAVPGRVGTIRRVLNFHAATILAFYDKIASTIYNVLTEKILVLSLKSRLGV